MAQHPVGFLASGWPWRCALYLVSGVLLGALTLSVLAVLVAGGVILLVVGVGAALLAAVALSGPVFARVERRRLQLVDLDEIQDPHQTPEEPGLRPWLRTRFGEQATWRELVFTLVSVSALWWLDLAVLGLAFALPALCLRTPFVDPTTWGWAIPGAMLLLASPYTITAWAGARAALTRILLAPRDSELGEQLEETLQSRARLVDAFEAARVQIERDLHDGAQQRLVSLNLSLGVMRLDVPPDSPLQAQLVSAQEQLSLALGELRNLVRGMNPQVLTDNGLVAAIEANAGQLPLEVTTDLELPWRLPQPVEAAAYYVVTEALANIAKHAQAKSVQITGRHHADMLTLEITDDGVGGVDTSAGTGIRGLADRLALLDGRVRVSSPVGGPTLLLVEIPCPFG